MKNILLFFSRLMQVAGIILLAYALYFGIAAGSMGKELMLLGIGGIVFYIGWAIQKTKCK
ncbi:MAG: hypothetical protein ACUZ8E_15715 [Candidatus Anammoxibacter sp.]